MPSQADWQELFPFEPRAIELDGLRYVYVDCGQGDTLLAVHGNPTWSFYWRELIRGLAPKYRVIAVDHIGCGRWLLTAAFDFAAVAAWGRRRPPSWPVRSPH